MKLLKKTHSLCPICLKTIEADVYDDGEKVIIKKECPEHGDFEDIYWSDSDLYKRFLKYQIPGDPIDNPNTTREKGCPYDCGLCNEHKTHTMLGLIDVTNRCNFHCPICFANAEAAGYVCEPTIEQIRVMMKLFREEEPVPADSLMLAGGEPTVREDIIEIVKMAKMLGFKWILVATNGKRIAEDINFTMQLKEAGMNIVYLQFDGLTPEVYEKTRGFNAWPLKQKAIENLKKVDIATTLVPTVVKGLNDDQVGDIIMYGVKNIEIVKSVNFQPVSFTGRISKEGLKKKRYTIPDLIRDVEKQTDGQIKKEDWFPIPAIAPLEKLVEKMFDKRIMKSSTHVHCGAGLYAFEDKGELIPMSHFIDLDAVANIFKEEMKKPQDLHSIKVKLKILARLIKTVDTASAPSYFSWKEMFKAYLTSKEGYKAPKNVVRKAIFIGSMHFMDPYNFDTQRVERCCIHYATPDGRIIPFCAYNSIHRQNVEKKFAKPISNR
ncbi:MAG: radical SAM protein [Candidatus Aenigmarchaeota archaeon]|nr:radical SAM protein [Candidatus Aenigmarchaeota archaeon]